ncbi:MAG TPA: L-2-hydroxyglutarate oxidase [Acidimicrobiales bacterium]|nr:L-2-hydroxyglutarate oxidase [Acidimicrobiales bacterium]
MSAGDIAVVGAGIVGLAVARRLLEVRPGARLVVFDKEGRVGVHQTGHNSGVLHAGVYYSPGSLKARLCRRGGRLLRDYCAERGIPVADLGKVIVARHDGEVPALERLWERATANNVPGLERLGPRSLAEIEPHVNGVAALHSPTSAVVDFGEVARSLADDVRAAGGDVRLGTRVSALRSGSGGWELGIEGSHEVFRRVVVCAGLTTHSIAGLASGTGWGGDGGVRAVPFRGHYHRLSPGVAALVRGLVYPVPDPAYPFLGIHLTPNAAGDVLVGPNAVLALSPEGYRWRDVDLGAVASLVAWPGTWRLVRRHWRAGTSQLATAVLRSAFAAAVRGYLPAVADSDLLPAPSGVRAQAVAPTGDLVDDFVVDGGDGLVVVRNAPSPAATSCLAIAEHIAALVD